MLVVYRYSYTATNPAGTQHCSTVASMLIFVNPFTNKLETPCTVWLSVNAFYRPILFLLNVTSISGCLADNWHMANPCTIYNIQVLCYNRNMLSCVTLQQKHFLWIILQLKIQFYVLLSSLYQVGQNQSEMNAYQQNYCRWLSSSVKVHADKFKQSELDSKLL